MRKEIKKKKVEEEKNKETRNLIISISYLIYNIYIILYYSIDKETINSIISISYLIYTIYIIYIYSIVYNSDTDNTSAPYNLSTSAPQHLVTLLKRC